MFVVKKKIVKNIVANVSTREDPLSYRYVKLIKRWLPGVWPEQMFGVKVPLWKQYYRQFIPIASGISLSGQFMFLYQYSSTLNFFQLGYCYLMVFFAIQAIAREELPNLKKYGVILKKILVDFHVGHLKYKGQFNEQVFDNVQRMSNMFTLYIIVMTNIGVSLFNIPPLYFTYRMGFFSGTQPENSTVDCIICYFFPGVMDASKFSWISSAFTIYLTYAFSTYVSGADIMLSLIAFQMIGNILILRNDLETFPRPKNNSLVSMQQLLGGDRSLNRNVDCGMFDAEENNEVHEKLVDCMKYHRMIVEFIDEVSGFFGPFLGLNYAVHITSCCLLLVECSRGGTDGILRFGPLTVIIFGELVMMSVVFEVVATVSEKLKDSLYRTPWECMDTKNRRTVQIMLINMQKPIEVTAMGITRVGVTTMAQILKATISYYTLLQSMQ